MSAVSSLVSSKSSEFDVAGLDDKRMPDAPPAFLISAVLWLRRFLIKLADLVVPAEAVLFDHCTGIGRTHIFGALGRLGVADILQDGPLSAVDLAKKTGSNADGLHRVMRAAVYFGVFELGRDGRYANNRLSRALLSGQAARAKEFAEYFSSKSNSESYLAMDYVLNTGRDGFQHVHSKDLWEWFDEHPDERETFAQMMMGVTFGEAPMVAKLYPFNEVKRLCDVGGGRGALISELAIRYPHLQCVLFDREGVIESAKPLLASRKVADRVSTVVGDFFQKVIPGCDAYLLKNVMHDWDDGRCITILKVCRDAMQPGNKILLVEIIVEPNDTANFGALRDAHVLTVCTGGRERSRDDFRRLLNAAGFAASRIYQSPIIAVIEGVAR